MQPPSTLKTPWASTSGGLWYRWRGYTVRWLLFGVIVQLYQPISAGEGPYWQQKLAQLLLGLLFGASCAVVFTAAENTLNRSRVNWKSWLLVIASWLMVKVLFVSVLAIAGESTD